jgi:hypothetical protein
LQKIFLDTTRLVAKYTDNLLVELWNYIKDGKLAQTAILLLAAQEEISMGTSHKKKEIVNRMGFLLFANVFSTTEPYSLKRTKPE